MNELASSRAFRCEGPDGVERTFWWRRLPHGNYDVRFFFLTSAKGPTVLNPLCPMTLQPYPAPEPDPLIGLFRMHRPPEVLTVGNNYATFFFVFLHEPLLLRALLALCLNRWLDREV